MPRMPRHGLLAPAVTAVTVALLAGCSGAGSGKTNPDDVTGVPATWLSSTAAAWPGSKSFGASVPTLYDERCLLGDAPPTLLGAQAEFTDVGFAGFGDDLRSEDSYRYLCDLWARDRYSGRLQLIKVADTATGRAVVDDFEGQTSTPVQDNTVSHERSGRLAVSVLTRWYPTNPQGAYQALYFDEKALAVVVLEVDSLDEDQFDAFSPQAAADALVAAMASAA